MPIEVFTKEQFEAALPKVRGERTWVPMNVVQGEYVYRLPVNEFVSIMIRSSVHKNGTAAPCGEDSIRCYLINSTTAAPWGSKISKYVTRVPGWRDRMLETLRALWRLGSQVRVCPKCGKTAMKIFLCKTGENKGRPFLKCGGDDCQNFIWTKERTV